MFSGIVETLGTIKKITNHLGCKDFTITPHMPFLDLNIGDSVAINGICLTVTQDDKESFMVTAVPETLKLTNLNHLKENSEVNLERAMKLDQRLGGHFVQGHVDSMGEITNIQDEQGALRVTIHAPQKIIEYLIPKGFITIDGMSITLIDVFKDAFTVTFIPHTIQNSVVKRYNCGTQVNLEVDMLAKMIKKNLQNYKLLETTNEFC